MAEIGGKTRSITNHDLPQEILMEILSRLRVKTLCKFKCVCKQWVNIISDSSYFHVLHHHQSQRKPMLLFSGRDYVNYPLELPPAKKPFFFVDLDGDVSYSLNIPDLPLLEKGDQYLEVVPSSCQNLICLATERHFFLWNPSIREVVRLPQPTCQESLHMNTFVYLRMIGGFGFIKAKNEYVIIHLITDPRSSFFTGFEILNFSAVNMGSWSLKKFEKKFPILLGPQQWGTFVNGTFFWIVYHYNMIISFNFEGPKFETLPLPGSLDHPYLLELKGNIALVSLSATRTNIWTLKCSENKAWTKDFAIDHKASCNMIDYFFPFGEVDEELLLIHNKLEENRNTDPKFHRGLEFYNQHKKAFRRLEKIEFPDLYIRVRLYTDTLFSFKSKN